MKDTRRLFQNIRKDYPEAGIENVWIVFDPDDGSFTCTAWFLADGPEDIDDYIAGKLDELPEMSEAPPDKPVLPPRMKPRRPLQFRRPTQPPISE